MFRAIVFAVLTCGFVPRCALEVSAGEVRIEKIYKIIEACRLGLHDISRVELDLLSSLLRFNMPFELGLFLGCKRYGNKQQKSKICMVLDTEQYRYQKFISDIAGQDILPHGNDVSSLIKRVRDWLAPHHIGSPPLLGGSAIIDRYKKFAVDLPAICRRSSLMPPLLSSQTLFLWSKRLRDERQMSRSRFRYLSR